MRTVVICGPESTGKTELCKRLSEKFNGIYIPEYAREYVEKLNYVYDYEDVVAIAEHQVTELGRFQREYEGKHDFLFVDTYLVITKVWFEHCFSMEPVWLQKRLKNSKIDMFLLCKPDLEWIYDPVRENGSDKQRKYLYDWYKREIEVLGVPFVEIGGVGNLRVENCAKAILNIPSI